MKIKVGSRGSNLALVQTNKVIDALKNLDSSLEFEVVIIKTKGDAILDKSLDKIGDKGLFVKELEDQLRQGKIDFAVHSLKDLPTFEDPEFALVPCLEREDPRDVLVVKNRGAKAVALDQIQVVATGSKRRAAQIMLLEQKWEIVPIRGNVESRIKKMLEGPIDATVLAAAGINRLNLKSNEQYQIVPLPVSKMVPAVAQGILACQVLKSNRILKDMLNRISDQATVTQAKVERTFLRAIEGGCHLPVGGYLEFAGDQARFYYLYGDENNIYIIKDCLVQPYQNGVFDYQAMIAAVSELAVLCKSGFRD